MNEVNIFLQGAELMFGQAKFVNCTSAVNFWYNTAMNQSENFKQESGPQIPTTEEVISIFKEQGETPESIEKYGLWFANKQKEAGESPSEYAILNFNIEVASLFVDAGMMDDAREYCDGAWNIVDNEVGRVGEENMSEELRGLCDKLTDVCDKII